jgi:LPXTG-motif cell wall-anchored protein
MIADPMSIVMAIGLPIAVVILIIFYFTRKKSR